MKARHLLVTGSSGLIASEIVAFFACRGWTVHGLDNNMRAEFRDNIHSADVAQFIQHFINDPRAGEVYNLGGGRQSAGSSIGAASYADCQRELS
jgi:nucleoside-diphosphate-sugar epimerase